MFLKLSNPQVDDSYLNSIKPHRFIKQRAELVKNKANRDKTPLDDLVVLLQYVQPERAKHAIDNYLWVLFVRNPLDRLLSAWRDRFNGDGGNYYRRVGLEIIKMYRDKNSQNVNKYPSLNEFFTFLRFNANKTRQMDVHWQPMYLTCDVCAIDFGFIGKYETIDNDVQTLLQMLNIEHNFTLAKSREPMSKADDPRYRELKETVPRQLTQFVLSNIYQTDYDLFGYDLQKDIDDVYGRQI